MRQKTFLLAASAVLIGTSLVAQPVAEGGRKFDQTMDGRQEVSGTPPNVTFAVGDPDGTGTALITANHGQGRICWEITVNNIVTPTRGHIHEAPAGTNGPIRVTFFETGQPVNLEDCTTVDRARIKDIIQNPQNYYVNIHNSAFPAGAIRGQMSK